MQHYVHHPEHTEAYFQGFDTMMLEIKGMGFDAARDKFNSDNPLNQQPSSLGAYYYAKGGLNALAASL